jgi:hypothetical protein
MCSNSESIDVKLEQQSVNNDTSKNVECTVPTDDIKYKIDTSCADPHLESENESNNVLKDLKSVIKPNLSMDLKNAIEQLIDIPTTIEQALLNGDSVMEVEESMGELQHENECDDKSILCLLRGNTKLFNHTRISRELKNTGADITHLYIKNVKGRSSSYGFVTFKNKDALEDFINNKCSINNENGMNNGYVFQLNNSEYIIVRRYKSNYTKNNNTSQYRPTKKLYISGFAGNNLNQVTEFLIEQKIEWESISIRTTDNDSRATVIVKDVNQGSTLIENSYNNKGIPFKDMKIKVRRFIYKNRSV